jgi:type VI protein secretion system component Hcp
MSERYFMLMGSPRRRQVLGPHRSDHHAGWLEIDSFSWGSPEGIGQGRGGGGGTGKAKFSQLTFSRTPDMASTQLFVHCHAGDGFDLVLLDVWDDTAQRSKVKFEFLNVTISSCSHGSDSASFTIDFADMGLIPAAGARTASVNPAMIKLALAGAAR